MMSCHLKLRHYGAIQIYIIIIIISAKALRGNVEIFGILFRIVLRSTSPVFSFILFFQLHQKYPNFTSLVTEGSSVKGVSQRQCVNECKRADQC